MSDDNKKETEQPENGDNGGNGSQGEAKAIRIELQKYHAEMAGKALREMDVAKGTGDAYIAMAFMLAYLQEMLGLDPNASMNNLINAYDVLLKNPKIIALGFREINDILLEKKIIVP